MTAPIYSPEFQIFGGAAPFPALQLAVGRPENHEINFRRKIRQPLINPSIKLGNVYDIRIIENGPPIIIPAVPLKNIIIAFGPNFIISGKSILIVSKTKLAGNKYRDATKYKFE